MIDLFPEALKQGEAIARAIPMRRLFARTQSRPGAQLVKASGSSAEYFDHRSYQPGDDLRFIDWNAYGRTEHYTIRLFQRETAPHVDVVLDYSPSLFITKVKSLRTLELVYYLLVAAEREHAKVRFFFIIDDHPRLVARDDLLQGGIWQCRAEANSVRMLDKVPLQAHANNIVISDLLFPGNPDGLCTSLTRTPGTALLFVPFTEEEALPNWDGSIQFDDYEGKVHQKQVRCDQFFLSKYRDAYTAHSGLWEHAALRYGILLRRISADFDLAKQMLLDRPIVETGVHSQ